MALDLFRLAPAQQVTQLSSYFHRLRWPRSGSTGLTERDYPVVAGINLVFGTAVMGINLVIDLVYALLDPRVRYQ